MLTLRDSWEELKISIVSVVGVGYPIPSQNIDNVLVDEDFLSTGLLGNLSNSNHGTLSP